MMSAGEELGRAEELRPNVPSAEANMSTAQLRDVGCAVRQGGFMGFTPTRLCAVVQFACTDYSVLAWLAWRFAGRIWSKGA